MLGNMIFDDPDKYNRSEANVLAAKNLLPITFAKLKASNTSGTWNGNVYTLNNVTFTVSTDSDGNVTKITTNGTSSAATLFVITTDLSFLTVGTKYTMSGCPENGSDTTYGFAYYVENVTGGLQWDVGGGVTFAAVDASSSSTHTIRIVIRNNINVSGKTWYPMFRLASDPSDEWQPYAKTNRELTTDKCENSVIAPVENGATASKGYSKGEHFIRDGKFCTVTASISQGETLTEGSNYKARNVGNILEIFSRNTILEVSLNASETKTITFDGNASGYIFSMLTDTNGSIYFFGESANAITPIVGSGATNVLVTKPTTSSIQIKNNLSWSVHFFILSARGGATVTTS